MAGYDVIRKLAGRLYVAARREELEGADADVALGDPGQHRALSGLSRQIVSPVVTRSERPRRRNSERRHRLAHDIFPKHRPKRRPAIAASRVGRPARPFKLDVPADAVAIDNLAQQIARPSPS